MNNDLISRSALKEDMKSRLSACNEWIEKAKDKETKIRASAVKAFIAEVIMTIDNAPTIEIATKLQPNCNNLQQGEWIEGENGNIKCNQCGCEIRYSYLIGNEPDFPKFCCDCGAKMKGGKK